MKRFLLIVSIILVTAAQLKAQTKQGFSSPAGAPTTILRFYPNPASAAITFDFQKAADKGYTLQVYNFLGRKMIEQSNLADHTTINLADFTRGMYIYKLFDKTGKLVETGKFQVSK